jgi:Ca-activated chloride channel family protein
MTTPNATTGGMTAAGTTPRLRRRGGSRASLSSLPIVSLLALLPFLVGFDPVRSRSAAVEEGNAKMKAGKADEALAAYDKAVAELPADPGAHFDRGTALAALSRFDEAADEFLRATEAKETSLKAAAFYNLGNAFFKKDKFKEAVETYKRALALDPKDERAKWNLEIALKKKRQEDEKKKQDKKDNQDKDKNKKDDQKDKQEDKQEDKKKDEEKPSKPDDDRKKAEDQKAQDEQNKAEEKPAAEKEIESVLDSLEKSPKDLEKQRARLRAVRRAPPARDW